MRRLAAGEPFFNRPFGAARRVRFLAVLRRTARFFAGLFLRRTGPRAVCAINAFTAGVCPVCVKAPGSNIERILIAIFTAFSSVLGGLGGLV
jgi:hypothetical protein